MALVPVCHHLAIVFLEGWGLAVAVHLHGEAGEGGEVGLVEADLENVGAVGLDLRGADRHQ